MEILLVGLLVIFVPLIMVAVGMSLFNKSVETISEVRKDSREFKAKQFANKFFKANGIDASWDSYINAFQKEFGRKPELNEITVPQVRAHEITQLLEVCRAHGIY